VHCIAPFTITTGMDIPFQLPQHPHCVSILTILGEF